MTTTTIDREIKFDRLTKDYLCYVDGRFVGARPNYHAGELLCNEIVHDMQSDGDCATATDLDGGAGDPPADPDPLPDPGPGGPGVPGDERPRAVTAQSIAIEAKLTTCPNCKGIHHPQACPEIRTALFAPAPWGDPALGRELCRMRWRSFPAFVTLLSEVHARGHLASYAASYQAFVASLRPDTDLTVEMVSATWQRIISGEPMPRLKAA